MTNVPTALSYPMANRRRAPRKGVRGAASVDQAGQISSVEIADISGEGIGLVSAKPISPGRRCDVTFALPSAAGPRTLTATVKVVHSSYAARERFNIGATFVNLEADVAAAIEAFLEND